MRSSCSCPCHVSFLTPVGQRYSGVSKLMLNNAKEDDTYLGEFISTQLCREAGLPAARVTHARVILNGRDLGFYVVVEAMNKDFLRQHFKDPSGQLYEAFMRDIHQTLELDSGEDIGQMDLRALLAAANEPSARKRLEALRRHLDVDRFVTFIAMEMLLAHWDGYAGFNRNNYRIYHDPLSDRLVLPFFPRFFMQSDY